MECDIALKSAEKEGLIQKIDQLTKANEECRNEINQQRKEIDQQRKEIDQQRKENDKFKMERHDLIGDHRFLQQKFQNLEATTLQLRKSNAKLLSFSEDSKRVEKDNEELNRQIKSLRRKLRIMVKMFNALITLFFNFSSILNF